MVPDFWAPTISSWGSPGAGCIVPLIAHGPSLSVEDDGWEADCFRLVVRAPNKNSEESHPVGAADRDDDCCIWALKCARTSVARNHVTKCRAMRIRRCRFRLCVHCDTTLDVACAELDRFGKDLARFLSAVALEV